MSSLIGISVASLCTYWEYKRKQLLLDVFHARKAIYLFYFQVFIVVFVKGLKEEALCDAFSDLFVQRSQSSSVCEAWMTKLRYIALEKQTRHTVLHRPLYPPLATFRFFTLMYGRISLTFTEHLHIHLWLHYDKRRFTWYLSWHTVGAKTE